MSDMKTKSMKQSNIEWQMVITVRIGRSGPNISSLMIRESNGTSSKMVGAIFLKDVEKD